ncbi:MAG TPA: DUF4421 family protein [Spirochaetota bacterium]|mgnify:FL=1|nr:DUF4421 family protein [Spirochaetota bacterium]HPM34229.1 DUF4421 family protein [Spirochaetota bacterium]
MLKLKFLFFAAAVFLPILSFSEESPDPKKENPIETIKRFIDFNEKFSIRVFHNPSTFMTLSMIKNDENVEYKANHKEALGLGLSYNGYGLSAIVKKNKNCFKDEDEYGNTNYNDLTFSKYGKHIGAEFFFRRYSGMYIENYPSSLPQQGKKRNDVELTFIGCYINYTFFEEFSFNEILKQSERSLGFSWSPLVGLYYDYFNFTSDGNLIPQNNKNDFPEFLHISSSSYTGAGIFGGIGAKYCFSLKLYISGSVSIGYGLGRLRTNIDDIKSKHASSSKAMIKLAIGFNGDSFGCGVIGSSEQSTYYINDTASISPFANYIEFFILFRF